MKYFNLLLEKCTNVCLVLLVVTITASQGYTQCSLSCNGTTQVSLSSSCDATITPNMILSDNGTSCMGETLKVEVSDDYGVIPAIDVVTNEFMGQTLTAMVIAEPSGNSCWGYIIIEDKLGPTITDCPMGYNYVNCLDMSGYPGPIFSDNCDGELSPVLLSEDITSPCNTDITKQIVRVYSAIDNKGNTSANTCTVRIRLERIAFEDIVFPDSLTIRNDNALSCEDAFEYDLNDNGRIDEGELLPTEFGVPIYPRTEPFDKGPLSLPLEDLELYPYPEVFCNTVVTFKDIVLPKIGCTQKIMRRWSVNEWHCDGERDTAYTQIIEVTDEDGPVLSCQETLELSTNTLIPAPGGTYGNFNCGSKIKLPLPTAVDNCAENLTYSVTYPSGHLDDYDGENITLPMGTNVVLYTVYDNCYNSSTCHTAVNIVDNSPPIAICDQNTTVSLTSGGSATVRPESFDAGSYDDCKMHCSLVRRMDHGSCECRIPEYCDLTYLGNYNGNNYYVSNYKIAGELAKNRAAAYGGNLVIFNNAAEEAWLLAAVRNRLSGAFWIGMKRFADTYLWDDHSNVSYNNFVGEEFPTEGNCVFVNGYNDWEAADCLSSALSPSDYNYVLEIEEGCGFTNGAKFCCEDAGMDHMVVLRVVDFYGNYNDCMVNLTVQDKSAPTLNCPQNRTVDCDHIYDRTDLDLAFGPLSIGESCGSNIEKSEHEDFNECGAGTLTRIWDAVSGTGVDKRIIAHCKQVITFENNDPFDGETIVCPKKDITMPGCDDPSNFGPEVTGTPEFTGGVCDRLGVDYDDQLFTFNNSTGNACFKILRAWEIIDWCRIDPKTSSYATWKCHQSIKISNTTRPVISGVKPINICSYDPSCSDADVTLEVFGEDDCTLAENLRWSYSIFLGTLNGGPTNFSNPAITNTGTGDHAIASGKYPLGSHLIKWTYYDGCGNATTIDQPFTITNCKAATAYCINGLAVEMMPIDADNDGEVDFGMIELWAKDFDAGSYHSCDYPVELSFSADVNDKNKTFTCTEKGNQIVEIWATVTTPSGELIQTYCSTFVDIQDNMNACLGQRKVSIDGNVYTEESQSVENVSVTLEGSPMHEMTNTDGEYAFPNMDVGGNYVINPYNNEGPINGVSTLDLIAIQRHILGIEALDSPYKYIAADIDNNSVINGIDLVELRKLILGIYTEFPNNNSWRFVDKDYTFENILDPLSDNFTEDYEISELDADMAVDFIAIKIGDLNNSVDLSVAQGKNTASTDPSVVLTVGKETVVEQNLVALPFTVETPTKGFQIEVAFDSELMEIVELQGIAADLTNSNFVVAANSFKLSWNSDQAIDGTLFKVIANKKSNHNLDQAFRISNEDMVSEFYNADGEVYATRLVTGENILELSHNNPNPFSDYTEVIFNLNAEAEVELSITNVQGRLIKNKKSFLAKGSHAITISSEDLGSSGIYYLTVKTNEANQTIKMVLID